MTITNAQPVSLPSKRILAAVMVALMFVCPVSMLADVANSPAPFHPAESNSAEAPAPQLLQIDILDGEGALNNIRQRTAREPIVEVKDENHKPVAGALILFTVLPNSGPAAPFNKASATFAGASSISMYTDAAGRAIAHGLLPNGKKGQYAIKVTATVGAVTTFAILHQTNVLGAWPPQANGQPGHGPHGAHSSLIKWSLVAGVVAVAVVLVVVLTRGHGTSITAGAGTVTHP
jgi:hypothetical protein